MTNPKGPQTFPPATYTNWASIHSSKHEFYLVLGEQQGNSVSLCHRAAMRPETALKITKVFADAVAKHEEKHGPIESLIEVPRAKVTGVN